MKKIKLLVMFGIVILLSSCIEFETVPYDQLDVTLTKYDTEFDFTSYGTFALPDSTVLKSNFLDEDQIDEFYAPGGANDVILTAVGDKFTDLGYTMADKIETADFVAVPTVLMVRRTSAVYYPPGWWWGYPGWGWRWGPWFPRYPWHPGYIRYQSYNEGTMVIEMVDGNSYRKALDWLKNNPEPIPQEDIPGLQIRWMANIDGYLSSNADYNEARAERGFNEAFDQSPYLGKN